MELMHIPNWLDETLGDAFGHISEELDNEFEVEGNITEIEYKSRDGFIPFTNGGVIYSAPINLDYLVGTGKGFTNEKVSESIDETVGYCYKSALEDFIINNRDELNGLYTAEELDEISDNINYHTLYEKDAGELAERLSEMESGWLEGYLFVEARIMFFAADNARNITGKDEIYFIAGVNLDYDYGRDKGLEETYEETVAVEDLTPARVNEIFKVMLDSI